ncbi:MAG: 30S ribosomal protein S8 [Candidatus Bathyarchaeia archaeon]
MSMQDPIADMLTTIRNGQMANQKKVEVPHSKIKVAILRVLQKEGYIQNFEEIDEGNNKKSLHIYLKYHNRQPVIKEIQRVSRTSCRVYTGVDKIPKVHGRLGTVILSTSEGILSGREARRKRVGGEVICYVW